MAHTAWTKASSQRSYAINRGTHHSSGLTSDVLIPRGGSSRRGKGRDQSHLPSEPKKSRDVQKLENLIEAVDSASYMPKYPKEGCFCRGKCLFDLGLPSIRLYYHTSKETRSLALCSSLHALRTCALPTPASCSPMPILSLFIISPAFHANVCPDQAQC